MTPVLPAGCVIAVLGAEGTGKTELSNALATRLAQRGIAAELVSGLEDVQTARIAAAAERAVVVADTTALVAAVQRELQTADISLYDEALAAQRGYALTLLMALDLPPQRAETPERMLAREKADTLLRAALTRGRIPYAVIHGRGPERLAAAWNAVNARSEAAEAAVGSRGADGGERGWYWSCDKCSDPACEHRLFSDLVAGRR